LNFLTSALSGDRRRWIALVVVCLGQLMIVVDGTVVNVALPSIQHDLGFGQASLTWVVNAYLITFGGFLLMAGRLGDLIGRKKVFLAGIVLFTVASVLCGLAGDPTVLIAARVLQGIGGAVAAAVILAILFTEFTEPLERAKAMSVYMFTVTAGGSLGLLAGGLLTSSVGWRWVFFVNVPIGVATLLLGAALIRENEGIGLRQGIDAAGSILVTAAMMIGVYAIVGTSEAGWASTQTLAFGGTAIALLAAFLVLESRIANPIIPLRVLRTRTLAGSSVVRALLATGIFSAFFLGALSLEHVHGYGALQTGLAFLPLTLAIGVLSLGITARLMERFGATRTLLAGLLVTVSALVLLSQAGADAAYFPTLLVAFALLGLGAGTAFMPLLQIAMADVPQQDAGLASAIVNASLQIGGALGLAALGAISSGRTSTLVANGSTQAEALTSGYQLAFLLAAGCVAAGVVLAAALLREPRRVAEAEVETLVATETEAQAA
jgi:EmrB/QacA subfamily drug resistance transporter